ncbi:hypothetical protein M404DRAFT_168026, partial [Pisolithus tinctorius Marx 270]
PHNQGDDPDPDPNDPDGDPNSGGSGDRDIPKDLAEPPEDPLIALARAAIELLACNACTSSESSSRTKLCKPDTFDGTDPKKLHTFLIQCELNFQDWPWAFHSDQAKVTFTQSFLKGMALEWFKLDLLGTEDPGDQPYWMDSWKEFIIELQTTFGPHDPVADTESQLDHLQMKDNHWVNKYVVCWVGKPSTLHKLHHLAQEIDTCYWERKEEIQGSSSGNKLSPNPSHNNQSKPSQEKSKTSSSSRNGNSSSQTQSKPALTSQTGSNTPKPDSSKLGKDGKLTPEEHKHQ